MKIGMTPECIERLQPLVDEYTLSKLKLQGLMKKLQEHHSDGAWKTAQELSNICAGLKDEMAEIIFNENSERILKSIQP